MCFRPSTIEGPLAESQVESPKYLSTEHIQNDCNTTSIIEAAVVQFDLNKPIIAKPTISIKINATFLKIQPKADLKLKAARSTSNHPYSSSKDSSHSKNTAKRDSSSRSKFYHPTTTKMTKSSCPAPAKRAAPPPPPTILNFSSFLKPAKGLYPLTLDKHEFEHTRPDFKYFLLRNYFKRPWHGHPTKRQFWVTKEEKKMLYEYDIASASKSVRKPKEKKVAIKESGLVSKEVMGGGAGLKRKRVEDSEDCDTGSTVKEGKLAGLKSAG